MKRESLFFEVTHNTGKKMAFLKSSVLRLEERDNDVSGTVICFKGKQSSAFVRDCISVVISKINGDR